MICARTFEEEQNIRIAALSIIAAATLVKTTSQRNKRKIWVKKWLGRREEQGCYENLMRELRLEDAEYYRRWIRMDSQSFELLLAMVAPLINRQNTKLRKAISAGERLALTLRYLATGETQSSLAFQFRIAQNTISGILSEVCRAIYGVLRDVELRMPETEEDWRVIGQEFWQKWNFPMCLGAMDGKHVRITPPPDSGSTYYNYKGDFSIVLLALVDADLKFTYVDVGTNGRISDGGVWAKSTLKRALDDRLLHIPDADFLPGTNKKVPYVIIADDAFPLSQHIMKPYPGRDSDEEKRIFNYRLSRARRVSENAFGILAARFQIYKVAMKTSPANCQYIILATCALHNFLRRRNANIYVPEDSIDIEDIVNHRI